MPSWCSVLLFVWLIHAVRLDCALGPWLWPWHFISCSFVDGQSAIRHRRKTRYQFGIAREAYAPDATTQSCLPHLPIIQYGPATRPDNWHQHWYKFFADAQDTRQFPAGGSIARQLQTSTSRCFVVPCPISQVRQHLEFITHMVCHRPWQRPLREPVMKDSNQQKYWQWSSWRLLPCLVDW